jgi:hypothetical protein
VKLGVLDVLVQDTTSGSNVATQNMKVTVSGNTKTAVGYTKSDGHCIFKSSSALYFIATDVLTIVVEDATGVLQSVSTSKTMGSLSDSITITTKSEYVFSITLTNSITTNPAVGLVVAATSPITSSLVSGTDGVVTFRAKNKNFDEGATFTISITDSSGAFVNQVGTSVVISGANQVF